MALPEEEKMRAEALEYLKEKRKSREASKTKTEDVESSALPPVPAQEEVLGVPGPVVEEEKDQLYEDAVAMAVQGEVTSSKLQHELKIDEAKADEIIQKLEQEGYIIPKEEVKATPEPVIEPVEHGPIHDYTKLDEIVDLPAMQPMPEPPTEAKASSPISEIKPEPVKAEALDMQVKERQKEKQKFSVGEIENIIRQQLGKQAKINNLSIVPKNGGMHLEAELDGGWKAGKISLTGDIVNEKYTIAVANVNVQARGYVKSIIESNIPQLSKALEQYFESQSGKKTESIQVIDQELVITYAPVPGVILPSRAVVPEEKPIPITKPEKVITVLEAAPTTVPVVAKPEKIPVKPEAVPVAAQAAVKPEVITAPLPLDEARAAYVKAKKRWEAADSTTENIKRFFKINKESKDKVEKEYEAAKELYEKASAEFILASFDNFQKEQEAYIKEHFTQGDPKRESVWEKIQRGYKYLGEINAAKLYKGDNSAIRFSLKTVNARTAIGLGLGGIAVTGALGLAVGAGALGAKRLLSGGGVSLAAYGALEGLRARMDRRKGKKLAADVGSIGELDDYLAAMVSKCITSGMKSEDLLNDPLYQELTKQKLETIRHNYESTNNGIRADLFRRQFEDLDERLNSKIKSGKAVEAGLKAVSVAAGAAFGVWGAEYIGKGTKKVVSGAGKAVGSSWEWMTSHIRQPATLGGEHVVSVPPIIGGEVPLEGRGLPQGNVEMHGEGSGEAYPLEKKPSVIPDQTIRVKPSVEQAPPPEVKPSAPAVAEEVNVPKPPHVEFKDVGEGKFEIDVNQRGIEGSLLDLLRSKDFAGREKILEYLKHFEVEGPKVHNTPKHLVHRWVLHLANEHSEQDWSVGDGGKYDLDRVLKGAHIEVDSDGELVLKDVQFMHPVETVPELPEVEAPKVPSMVEQQYPEYSHPNFENVQGELPKAPVPPQPHPGEVLPYRQGIETSLHELEGRTSTPAPAETTPAAATSTAEPHGNVSPEKTPAARIPLSESLHYSVSGDLKEKLGPLYDQFMEDRLHISPESLDRVQDMNLNEVLKMFRDDKKFTGLVSLIDSIKEQGYLTENYFATTDVKKFLQMYTKLLLENKIK